MTQSIYTEIREKAIRFDNYYEAREYIEKMRYNECLTNYQFSILDDLMIRVYLIKNNKTVDWYLKNLYFEDN